MGGPLSTGADSVCESTGAATLEGEAAIFVLCGVGERNAADGKTDL